MWKLERSMLRHVRERFKWPGTSSSNVSFLTTMDKYEPLTPDPSLYHHRTRNFAMSRKVILQIHLGSACPALFMNKLTLGLALVSGGQNRKARKIATDAGGDRKIAYEEIKFGFGSSDPSQRS
jgi:hypothetical protein